MLYYTRIYFIGESNDILNGMSVCRYNVHIISIHAKSEKTGISQSTLMNCA